MLEEYGKKPKRNKSAHVHPVGIKANEIWKLLAKEYELKESIDILSKKKEKRELEIYKKAGDSLAPMPGLLDILKKLKTQKIKIVLCSSTNIKAVLLILEALHIKDFFEVLVSGQDVKRGKTDPEGYLLAADKLRVQANFCVVLEDAQSGVLAGKAAGMKVIAVPNQYTKEHDFSKADKLVKSLKSVTIDMLNSL